MSLSDGERDDSDSYWNISRREERAGKKLKRKNLWEGRRFSQQQHLLLVSIVVLSLLITCVNISSCDQTVNTVGACIYIRLYAYLIFFYTYTVCIVLCMHRRKKCLCQDHKTNTLVRQFAL